MKFTKMSWQFKKKHKILFVGLFIFLLSTNLSAQPTVSINDADIGYISTEAQNFLDMFLTDIDLILSMNNELLGNGTVEFPNATNVKYSWDIEIYRSFV